MRPAESALEFFREIPLAVRRIIELILVLDVHRAVVARPGQHREESLPIHGAVTRQAEAPPVDAIYRLNACAVKYGPKDLCILQMHVVDLADELARRRHGIHELPN